MAYLLSTRSEHSTRYIRPESPNPEHRPHSGVGTIDQARIWVVRDRYRTRTVEGTLWNDLPFLATDMTEFWINNCASLSGVHRLDFASFLAKLASTRVNKDRVSQVALVLFTSTFEVGRDLGHADEPDQEDSHRTIRMLDLRHLLPAACSWIKEAGHVLIQLSDVSWNDCPSTIDQGGKKFVGSEFGQRSPTGFTPWRLMNLLKRLHEFQDEVKGMY